MLVDDSERLVGISFRMRWNFAFWIIALFSDLLSCIQRPFSKIDPVKKETVDLSYEIFCNFSVHEISYELLQAFVSMLGSSIDVSGWDCLV